MKAIKVRYGASLPLSFTIDDDTAVEASIIIGEVGEIPVFTKSASIVDGAADLTLDPGETMLPLGTYKYQINVEYDNGELRKFPEPNLCDPNDFPDFVVAEALDEEEVSS